MHNCLVDKKLKQLNTFLSKIRPTVPLTETPLVRPKSLTKGRGRLVSSMFPPKSYYFLHHQFFIPSSCTHILLFFSIHIFFFAHTLTYNSRHFFFWRIIIDIIVFGRKRKTCIIFRRKINGIVA